MIWPWSRKPQTENRASYGDTVINALVEAAQGEVVRSAHTTAALESCAAIYAAAFAVATIEEAPDMVRKALAPGVRSLMARNMIRCGEDLHLIDVDGPELRLLPVGAHDVRGGIDRSTWWVRADLFGPSGNITRLVPYEAVLHSMYSVEPSRPWAGVSPLGWASQTGRLAGGIEQTLANESVSPSAQVIPVPADGGDDEGEEAEDPLRKMKGDLARAKGAPMLVESTAGGWDEGPQSAPRFDWRQQRIGPDWPDVLRATRADVFDAVASACNVPPALLDTRSEGTSQRESLRRFAHLALEPLAELVAAELRLKLDSPDLRFDFKRLAASDMAGRVRAFKGLVEAGRSLDDAAALTGLLMEGD